MPASALRRLLLAGAVAVSALPVASAHADDADLTKDCAFRWRPQGVLVFAGYAVHPSPSRPAAVIMLTCTVSNLLGSYTSTTSAPGYAVATAGSGYLRNGGLMTTCTDVRTTYVDGTVEVYHRCVTDADESGGAPS